jgi:hypothetical protein
MLLVEQDEFMRVIGYTCSHDRLTIAAKNTLGEEATIELFLCKEVKFQTHWRAGQLSIVGVVVDEEEYIRISDGVLDVTCKYAQRWETPEREVVSLKAEDFHE